MRSSRLLVERVTVGGEVLDTVYADVFVVVREGETGPGANDWEVAVRTAQAHRLVPGEHDLVLDAPGARLSGRALLRFSDGHQHLFRGDGTLVGYGG